MPDQTQGATAARRSKASFGNTRQLPSGRWQARYTGPDGRQHKAPTTYDTKKDAEHYLAAVRTDISRATWQAAPTRRTTRLTFATYSERWLKSRRIKGRPLAERTRAHYQQLLDRFLLPTFGPLPLSSISVDEVSDWYDGVAVGTPTYQAHAYSLLRAIMATAADPTKNNGRPLVAHNPCGIVGGGSTRRSRKLRLATVAEIDAISDHMPERYRLAVQLAAWCALRFGEVAALERRDIDTKRGVLHVNRGVVRAAGEVVVKPPKSDAGVRDVTIPPHLMPMVREHLLRHTDAGREGLLFPARGGGYLAPSSLYRVFTPAREAAGRPDLRFHDLRHTGLTFAAQAGATTRELMARGGHSTSSASLLYQHAADERDAEIARKLSERVAGDDPRG